MSMHSPKGHAAVLRWLAPTVTVLGVLILWQVVCSAGLVPSFLLPSPVDVVCALVDDAPLLAQHCVVTLGEALIGLCAAWVQDFFWRWQWTVSP